MFSVDTEDGRCNRETTCFVWTRKTEGVTERRHVLCGHGRRKV